jgi:hypothetical protein
VNEARIWELGIFGIYKPATDHRCGMYHQEALYLARL